MKDRWLKIYFVVALIGFAFAYGVATGVYKVFPYDLLERIAAAGLDWVQHPRHNARISPDKFLSKARYEGSGAAVLNRSKIHPGLTLLTGFFGDSTGIRLVNIEGEIVHEWRIRYNDIWPKAQHLRNPPHDWDTEIHGAVLLPDGDIVINFQYAGSARIDRCSNVIWTLDEQTHHSIFVDEEGQLWIPNRRLLEIEDRRFSGIPVPIYEEFLLKVSPDGEILREISILDSIVESGFEGVLFANGAHGSEISVPLDHDFTHLNDIEILAKSMASVFPRFAGGDILVSLRNLNLLLVLDRDSAKIKWSQTGPFLRQHDPDFRPDGTISVFDNRRDGAEGSVFGGSRILALNPSTFDIDVVLGGDEMTRFYTETQGDHQYLPNGNLLVTASEDGYAFEIAPDGEKVWSYLNRWDKDSVAPIARATRYSEGYNVIPNGGQCM